MKLKHMSLALALAGMVSVQAQASEAAVEAATPATLALTAAPVNAVSEDDLVALFGAEEAAKPLQLAALSDAEMRETEGAWWPVVYRVGGGLAGMYGAGYGYLAGGGRNPRDFGITVLGGFASGVWSPVKGLRSAALTFGGGFSGGLVSGFATRR